MNIRARLVVSGVVQGVCFRMFACREASRLGVTGWVRNLRDGRVESVAEADEKVLREFVDWFRCGPDSARVDNIEEEYGVASGEFRGFQVRY